VRLAATCLLALAIAPGTWLRSEPEPPGDHRLQVIALEVETPADWPPGLVVKGLWQIDNGDSQFGGFSTLALEPDGGFRAYSDFGRMANIPRPPATVAGFELGWLPADPNMSSVLDIESAWLDTDSGTVWLAYEHHNAIRRLRANGESVAVRPPAMRQWGKNSGPESMLRLPNGHFLVLAERDGIGLLFEGDPVEKPRIRQFKVSRFDNFRPTDMALLPDGRVLVLLRELRAQLPPFATMLALGDPSEITEGEEWQLTQLLQFDRAELRENYEGLAVEPDGGDALNIWLISDDNRSALQRNLLLGLRWQIGRETETAREGKPDEPYSD